jgi:Chitobiase/beta-hexosaminidase C-terminal domain
MSHDLMRPLTVAFGCARSAAAALLRLNTSRRTPAAATTPGEIGVSSSRVRARAGAVAAAAAVGALAVPAGASAAINSPPKGTHSIIVFPVRDFVSATGYAPADRATVEVFRNGVLIGRAADVVPQDDPKVAGFDGLVEVNHPGGGCWGAGAGSPGVTPDILPGDVVRITTEPGVGDETTTANVTAEQAVDVGNNVVVVHGTAQDAAGNPLPIDQIEQRIVANKQSFAFNGRRTLRATSAGDDGTLSYDAPGSIHWTARYDLNANDNTDPAGDVAMATTNQSRGMWLGNPAGTAEGTIYENGEVGGPAIPDCTAPLASNAVTSSSPNVVNASFAAASAALTLSGVAQADATAVSVSLDDQDPHTAPLTADATLTNGTWSASIPAFAVNGLTDGTLTASARYTLAAGSIDGAPLDILKDTTAPGAPTAAPAGGLFKADQSVKLTAEAGATIHFTTDGSPAAADGPAYSGPIAVSQTQTINAIAVDRAGNAGPVASFAYQIDKLAPTTTDNVSGGPVKAGTPVTLFTDDGADGSGVSSTWYTTDGTNPSVESNPSRTQYDPAHRPSLADGQRITYYSIDRAGNAETPHASAPAKVDTAAPTTSDNVAATGFSAKDIVVTLSADDGAGGSGVAATYYTTDGSDPRSSDTRRLYDAASRPTLADGTVIKYSSVDNVGNVEAVKSSAPAKVDTVAPTTTDSVPTTFSGTPVTVTLAASDGAGSGVAKTWFTTDGSNPLSDANPNRSLYSATNKPVLRDGQTVRYASIDNVGNAETAKVSAAAKVDTTAPTTTDDVPTTWQNAPVRVTLTRGDGSGSGVARTWYTTDGSDPSQAASARRLYDPAAPPTLSNGQSIRYFSVDNVDNAEGVHTSAPAKVDTTAPTTSDNVPTGFVKADLAVTLTASDGAGSGVAATWYTTDNSDPRTSSTRKPYDAANPPVLANGRSLRYASEDQVGNMEVPKTTGALRVDGAAPTTGDDAPADWQTADVTVTLAADDGTGSGVATTWYTTNGSDPTVASNATRKRYDAAAKPVLTNGQAIRYASVDNVGNVEAVHTSTAVKVDKNPPRTTDDVPAGGQTSAVTVTLTATDGAESGVAATWYTTDGSDPTVATNPARKAYDPARKPVLTNGQAITYASVDNVGRTEAAHTSSPAKVAAAAPAPAGGAGSASAPESAPPVSASAPAPLAPAAPAPAAAPTAAAAPALPVRIAPVISAASARAGGVPVTVTVPAGASVVQVQVTRLTGDQPVAAAAVTRKRLATVYAFPKHKGAFRVRLASAALRRQFKPGVYELRIRVGKTRAKLGAPTVKKFRISR